MTKSLNQDQGLAIGVAPAAWFFRARDTVAAWLGKSSELTPSGTAVSIAVASFAASDFGESEGGAPGKAPRFVGAASPEGRRLPAVRSGGGAALETQEDQEYSLPRASSRRPAIVAAAIVIAISGIALIAHLARGDSRDGRTEKTPLIARAGSDSDATLTPAVQDVTPNILADTSAETSARQGATSESRRAPANEPEPAIAARPSPNDAATQRFVDAPALVDTVPAGATMTAEADTLNDACTRKDWTAVLELSSSEVTSVPRSMFCVAMASALTGDRDRALLEFLRFADRFPSDGLVGEAQLHAGKLYVRAGNRSAARTHFELAVKSGGRWTRREASHAIDRLNAIAVAAPASEPSSVAEVEQNQTPTEPETN
ncbi:MAG: hypothetical protein H7Z43_12880 [Clostridia bacterium]|nr:hypothetical protein [Deltaproteobacteria bacterium]